LPNSASYQTSIDLLINGNATVSLQCSNTLDLSFKNFKEDGGHPPITTLLYPLIFFL